MEENIKKVPDIAEAELTEDALKSVSGGTIYISVCSECKEDIITTAPNQTLCRSCMTKKLPRKHIKKFGSI